jgi:hypothetical protein
MTIGQPIGCAGVGAYGRITGRITTGASSLGMGPFLVMGGLCLDMR